jgi:hypothetical protein
MKRDEKIKVFKDNIGTYNILRCYFDYDRNYYYFYGIDINNKLMYGIEEDDFSIDGFQIRKVSNLKKIELRNDITSKIGEELRVLDNVEIPNIDITSWESVFKSLYELGEYITIQSEDIDPCYEEFFIGKILKVHKSYVVFNDFDASGEWQGEIKIWYRAITSVTFRNRYTVEWERYLKKHNLGL